MTAGGGHLYVCVTCDRHASEPRPQPSPGRKLADAVRAHARAVNPDLPVRAVECLNGCLKPCNASLRAPGKATIRFSHLGPEDVEWLLEAAAQYCASSDGDVSWTEEAARKLSVSIPPLKVA